MTTTTELQNAKDKLIGLLQETDTIYTVLRSVSKSGLSRSISFFIIKNGDIHYINHDIAKILGYRFNKFFDGLIVKRCGTDAGFHVVHTLLRELNAGLTISHRWI